MSKFSFITVFQGYAVSLNERTNEWMNAYKWMTNERYERTNEWTNEWTNERTNEQMKHIFLSKAHSGYKICSVTINTEDNPVAEDLDRAWTWQSSK